MQEKGMSGSDMIPTHLSGEAGDRDHSGRIAQR
jgi:hypothetical protein